MVWWLLRSRSSLVKQVQGLIERCLPLYMNQVAHLHASAMRPEMGLARGGPGDCRVRIGNSNDSQAEVIATLQFKFKLEPMLISIGSSTQPMKNPRPKKDVAGIQRRRILLCSLEENGGDKPGVL